MRRAATGFGFFMLLMMWGVAPATGQVGERPRDTDYTEDAEDAIEDAEDTEDEAERLQYYQLALTSAQSEIAENVNNPLGHRLAAIASLALGQYVQAGEHFDRATELYPLYEIEDQPLRERSWINLYQQASPMVSSGDYEGATAVFEDAHAIYSARPEVMITLGQLYAQMGEDDLALQYIGEADAFMASDALSNADSATVAQWQEQASVLPQMRAQVLAALGRLAEAEEVYRELIEANPSNLEYAKGLAVMLMDQGKEEQALEIYADLLGRPGLTGADYYSLGAGFYRASDYELAARAFSGAVDVNAFDRDALEMWARSLALDSLHADIPPVARQWIALDPYGQTGYIILAQAANSSGDTETTQEAMARAQELEVSVDQLQLSRFGGGGGTVSGSVVNKTLEAGTLVTLRFTFYGENGDTIGTITTTVNTGAENMTEIFRAEFDSAEVVGGYGYEVTIG
jgi:tetratricopeptide (TPR) repeat protein